MALITDPDDLNEGVEGIISVVPRAIALVVAGNLSNDGVTGTITRQTGLSFSLVSALERNYANAA